MFLCHISVLANSIFKFLQYLVTNYMLLKTAAIILQNNF